MALELHYSEVSSHKAYINACFKVHKFCCHFFSCQSLLLLSTNVFNDKQYISLGTLVPNSKDWHEKNGYRIFRTSKHTLK